MQTNPARLRGLLDEEAAGAADDLSPAGDAAIRAHQRFVAEAIAANAAPATREAADEFARELPDHLGDGARADEELVIAGAMLHDIGKLESYRWEDGVFDTTERGRLAGHVAIGAMMFRSALEAQAEPPCTEQEAMLLEHFILSHHGKLEYGAPVRPMTLEAEILHFADDTSAKTAAINDAYGSPEFFPGDARLSTKRVWQLDQRWLFRGDADFGREDAPGGRKDEAADQVD